MHNFESANITVMVKNMDSAVRFYTETLGFKLLNRFGDHWADVEGPGISIGLHPANENMKLGDNMQIGLNVIDIDSSVKELTEKGIRFEIIDDEMVRLALFTDPDGNALYLVQPKEH